MTTDTQPETQFQFPWSARDRQFLEFHTANPAVFGLFCELAERALQSGERIGARCIGEQIRWRYHVELRGTGKPRLNDYLWPRYARLLASIDTRFADFFEFREQAMQGGAA